VSKGQSVEHERAHLQLFKLFPNEEDMAPQSLGGQNKTHTHKLTLKLKINKYSRYNNF
jgi:hypothetical protein